MANKQYVIGRGKVYFDVFTANTIIGTGERYLGNTPNFSLSIASENLDHYDADEGIKSLDRSVTLSLTRTGSIVCDNIDVENVALFFLSATGTQVQAAATGETDVFPVLVGDRYYQLGVTTANPSGVRDVSAVVIATATVAVDYTVDAALGRIYIVEDGVLDGDTNVTVTYDVAARSRKTIISSSSASVEGALRFVAYNPTGPNTDYYMPSVKLSPNGDMELKGDAWQQMSFNIAIQERDDTTEAIYMDGRPYVPA